MAESFWNEQRIDRLKNLYEAGLSYSQIAADLGAASRNMVGGKIDRLGLGKRVSVLTPEQREQARQRSAERNLNNRRNARGTKTIQIRKPPMQEAEQPSKTPFIGRLNIAFRDLRDFKHDSANQCRYIADEPPGPDYLACGNETLAGQSYCSHCAEMLKPKQLTQEQRIHSHHMGIRRHQRALRRVA